MEQGKPNIDKLFRRLIQIACRSQTAGPSTKKRAVDFVAELEKRYLTQVKEMEKSAPQPPLKKQKKE